MFEKLRLNFPGISHMNGKCMEEYWIVAQSSASIRQLDKFMFLKFLRYAKIEVLNLVMAAT